MIDRESMFPLERLFEGRRVAIAVLPPLRGSGLQAKFSIHRERAKQDPIGSVLLGTAGFRKALDPAQYQGLFELEGRPILIFDRWGVNASETAGGWMRPLAPKGRLPEPEAVPISRLPEGAMVAFGFACLVQALARLDDLWSGLRSGAPLGFDALLGMCALALGILLLLRDPSVRRRFGLVGLGPRIVIGAGWLRDRKGNVFTVDDTLLLVDARGTVRCVQRDRVSIFYLSAKVVPPEGAPAGRGTIRAAARRVLRSVGVVSSEPDGAEMPSIDEPLRLLLSSWTYPEPRPDLAMRE
jgi:hypothetical protein